MAMNTTPIFAATPFVSNCQVVAANTNRGQNAWTWGSGGSGILGDNTQTGKSSPISVVGSHNFVLVSIGNTNQVGLGLKLDGTLWSWGSGSTNGEGALVTRSSPVSVGGHHICSTMHTGFTHSLALRTDGKCITWGSTNFGSIGDNFPAGSGIRSVPVFVAGSHTFISAATGSATNIAIKSDGTAWTWGYNTEGACGDSTTTERSSPVSVVGAHSFTTAIAITEHAAALKSDGSCWTWGWGISGQLGQGTSASSRQSPVSVIGGHSFIAVMNQYEHSIALKADGSCWAWGKNTSGELGDGTVTNRSSPVSVIGNHSFISIARQGSAGATSAALKADGSAWTWGLATSGALGHGFGAGHSRSSPVSVLGGYFFTSIALGTVDMIGLSVGNQYARLVSGSGNGTRVDNITVQAVEATTGGMVRIFLNDMRGNISLLKEIPVSATSPTSTIPAFASTTPLGIVLPPGSLLVATTNNSEPINVIASGGVY